MIPIPRLLLPHEVEYREYIEDTGEGSSFANKVTLSNVKIEERKQVLHTNNGSELVGNALLFYDYVNSLGLKHKPLVGSKITFEDRTYEIVDVEVLRDITSNPHHYEIMLK